MKSLLQKMLLMLLCVLAVSDGLKAQSVTLKSGATLQTSYCCYTPGVVTFAVRNNNSYGMVITGISTWHWAAAAACATTPVPYDLYTTTTDLTSTNPNISNWTKVTTSNFIGGNTSINANTPYDDIFTGLQVVVPANSTMRIAIGFTYNNAPCYVYMPYGQGTSATNANGVDLLISTDAVGVFGNFPSPTGTNYSWPGSIVFEPQGFPCADTLDSAKVIAPDLVCPNRPFQLKAGITPSNLIITDASHSWEYSDDGRTWSNYSGVVNSPAGGLITDMISKERWYRCNVTCQTTGLSYMTPAKKVGIQPFYYCYCVSGVKEKDGGDIGNVTIMGSSVLDTVLAKGTLETGNAQPVYKNPNASRTYTGYHDSLAWPCLYRDSTFTYHVTQIFAGSNFKGGYLQAYVDYNRDGIYNPLTERVFQGTYNEANVRPHTLQFTAKVPADTNLSKLGATGLRFVLSESAITGAPCDSINGTGEVEDYIVKICAPPCAGPVDAGIVVSTDTNICKGYEYILTDTTYADTVSGFSRSWQLSGDGINWRNVPNSLNSDTLNQTFTGQPMHYRLRTICLPTHDTSYSPSSLVNAKESYKCYCYSRATGGEIMDTSDVGGFAIAGYVNNAGGPHVLNQRARNPRTDYTEETPIELITDSLYGFYVYHTMPVIEHGDAKVTIFMDFDNDNQYDIPNERIYSGYTSIGNHTLTGFVLIPKHVITDVPTGMRVILNNNVSPNVPSDEACGPYVSGETEDYMVIFRRKWAAGIENVGELNGFNVHPNPTSGRFHVQFSSRTNINDVKVRVTNMTGQLIKEVNYSHEGGMFYKEIDLSGSASGMYFVELHANGQKMLQKLTVQ